MALRRVLGTRQGDSVPGGKCEMYPESAVERGDGRAQGASGREYGAAQHGQRSRVNNAPLLRKSMASARFATRSPGRGNWRKGRRERPMIPV